MPPSPLAVHVDALRVSEGEAARLAQRPTRDDLGLDGKDEGRALLHDLAEEMEELQRRLWAENRRSLLLVLQGMDAAGKDGTIRRVMGGLNPQGAHVAGFKQPSADELDHDYLWRIHREVPRRGEVGIFNRSHYEDVGIVRVNRLVPDEVWRRRYGHIRDFERMLADEGTAIVKVWLHISRDEQRERFQARLDDPDKRWKFSRGDLEVRARWDDFQAAYEQAITETSTPNAPWYVVPADRKWVRDVAVASIVVSALRTIDPHYPEPEDDLDGLVIT